MHIQKHHRYIIFLKPLLPQTKQNIIVLKSSRKTMFLCTCIDDIYSSIHYLRGIAQDISSLITFLSYTLCFSFPNAQIPFDWYTIFDHTCLTTIGTNYCVNIFCFFFLFSEQSNSPYIELDR